MKIIIDGDSCPIKNIIKNVAKKRNLCILIVTNLAHFIEDEEMKVIRVDINPQAADIAIMNHTEKGDVIVTEDYGLAAMVLGKGAYAISSRGLIFTNKRIDSLLEERHIKAKCRRSGKKTKGPKKLLNEDKEKFQEKFIKLLNMLDL